MSTTVTSTRRSRRRWTSRARASAPGERRRFVRADGRTERTPGVRVEPGRDVERDTVPRRAIHVLDHRREKPADLAIEPRAEQRIDDDGGTAEVSLELRRACSPVTGTTRPFTPSQASWFASASPVNRGRSEAKSTTTSLPHDASLRATTKPSPPLFPAPQTTATEPGVAASRRRTSSAAPRPAFSMSVRLGTAQMSIA